MFSLLAWTISERIILLSRSHALVNLVYRWIILALGGILHSKLFGELMMNASVPKNVTRLSRSKLDAPLMWPKLAQ